MDKILLRLVGLFKGFFNSQGIDYARMITIVEAKLTMDKRRVYMNWRQRQQQKENTNHLNSVLFFYTVMGLFIATFLFAVPSLLLGMILVHTYVLFMMSMTLITDFSTVLLDTTDNQVILPRPVSSRTLFMARLVHILIYLLQFTIAIAIFPLAVTFYKYGFAAGIVMIITVILTVLMAVFSTYILYLLIIRFSNESRVRDIVTYSQIFMAVIFMVSFQVLPRMINLSQLSMQFELHWYAYLLPPVWMALTIEAIVTLNFDVLHISMIVLAFIVPILTFWVMNKYLAPSFAQKLAAMNNGDSIKKDNSTTIIQKEKKPVSSIVSHIICKAPAEKSSFEITWKITGRDKSFKLQFYPGLAYIAVFIFIFVFNSGNNIAAVWNNLPASSSFLWFFYIPMMTVSSSLMIASFNENYLAAWVYHSMPVGKPGMLVSGMAKSLFIKFFVPVFTCITIFCLYVWGLPVIDDALFAFCNNLFCFLIFANLSDHYLPFSRQPNTQQQTGKFLKALLQLIIVSVTVGLHYLLIFLKLPWLLWVLIPLLMAACFLLIKRLQNLSWAQISI
ncbi:hypothetical protein FRZ67_13675 [Panacibacter ginsenosidivorans]|uniref:Uncharacterized protein n=1 Tax=Panacibacter ginsenosidivorans TaxID=1813871 RepID=A0A5B8VDE7_9BACT|nr:hypothetical protein [Panacibacter ginsenosidivorans]QEC68298.1 hypothetical protein FRZ67_13675 [Panacibacter ginsenosidivorans]